MPSHFYTMLSGMPAETATPKLSRSPSGEACPPSSPAACITACTGRQPFIRDHGYSRTPRPWPRWPCRSQTPYTMFSVSSRAEGTGMLR